MVEALGKDLKIVDFALTTLVLLMILDEALSQRGGEQSSRYPRPRNDEN
jgi:hypothetical protein